MEPCPNCGAERPDDAGVCPRCGVGLRAEATPTEDREPAPDPVIDADFDEARERERFERRYGIDIGDRSVDEFLEDLDRQDYSVTGWVWVIAIAETVWVGLLTFTQLGPGGWELLPAFVAMSVLLAIAIFADTRSVGLFRPWSKTRWTYVLLAFVPICGQIGGVLYLVLRRFMRQRTERHRRRLLEAGFDIDLAPSEG